MRLLHAVVILLLLINVGTIASVASQSESYTFRIGPNIVELRLYTVPEDRWDLGTGIFVKFFVKSVKLYNRTVFVLRTLVKYMDRIDVVEKLLGVLDKHRHTLQGEVYIPTTPTMVLYAVKKDLDSVLVVPQIVAYIGNTSYLLELPPKYFVIPHKKSYALVVAGVCRVNTTFFTEICVYGVFSYTIPSGKEYVLHVDVKHLCVRKSSLDIRYVVNNTVLASTYVESSGTYTTTELTISAKTMNTLCLLKHRIEGSVVVEGSIDDTEVSWWIPWSIECVGGPKPPRLDLYVYPSKVLAGDNVTLRIVVVNRNEIPMLVKFLKIYVDNDVVKEIRMFRVLKPSEAMDTETSVQMLVPGGHRIVLEIAYTVGTYELRTNVSRHVVVSPSIVLKSAKDVYSVGEPLTLTLTVFRSFRSIAIEYKHGNKTSVLTVLRDVSGPTIRELRINASLGVGTYMITAKSIEGVVSNTIIVKIVNATTTPTNITKKPSVKISKLSMIITPRRITAVAGSTISVNLVFNTTLPSNAKIRLYKYEPSYTPPWILVPTASISKLSDRELKLSFKAPARPGLYRYRIDVVLNGKTLAQGELQLNVTTKSVARTASVEQQLRKPLIPFELFVPIVGTAAIAAFLLYRRARR